MASSVEAGDVLAVTVPTVTIAYLVWKIFKFVHSCRRKPFKELPMPPDSHWLLGHSALFALDLEDCLHALAEKSANAFGQTGFWAVHMPAVVITHPEDVRAVLTASSLRTIPPHIDLHCQKFLGKRNLLILNDRVWKFHRKAVARALSSTVVDDSRVVVQQVMDTLMTALRSKCTFPLTKYDVGPLMKMITIDIFGKTSFSTDLGCCRELKPSPFVTAFEFLGDEFIRRLNKPIGLLETFYWIPTAANRRHTKERAVIRDFLKRLVQERANNASETPRDLLTSLMTAHEQLKEEEEGSPLVNQDDVDETMVDTLVTLLFAGYDTSSIALTYALHQLATHPEVEEQLVQEVRRTEKVEDLVYCRAVVLETLRLFPSAALSDRTTSKDMELRGGFVIPRGTLVSIPIWTIQRLETVFPRPLEFLPTRWAKWENGCWKERDETDHNDDVPPADRTAFFTFSVGGRSCPGQKFAMQETVVVLARLIKELRFTLSKDYQLQPCRTGTVQQPKGGMPMKIEWRN